MHVATFPRGPLGRAVVDTRVRLRRRTLDAVLAGGEDPWSSAVLMARAAQIASPAHRERLARSLDALVDLAARRGTAGPRPGVRRCAVLRERETLAGLARRLRAPAPMDVGVIARLSLLVWDEASPAFDGGRPVEMLAETVELCSCALVD